MKNLYGTLGVGKSASDEEIKAAFRRLAREHHPDTSGQDGSEFARVREAFEILSNSGKRALYDTEWGSWLASSGLVACPRCGWANATGRVPEGQKSVCCHCAAALPTQAIPNRGHKRRLPKNLAEALVAVVSEVQSQAPDLASDLVRMGFQSLRRKISKATKG